MQDGHTGDRDNKLLYADILADLAHLNKGDFRPTDIHPTDGTTPHT